MYWYEYRNDGEIFSHGSCPEGTPQSAFGNRQVLLLEEELSDPQNKLIIDGEVLDRPLKPNCPADWNWEIMSWIPDLFNARKEAKKRISETRDLLEIQGFPAYGKVFDSDPVAVQRISIAVQAAQAVGESFSIEWTCADNSTITLDYNQMQALPAFMATAANTLHVNARRLKALIDTAETIEEIESIQWS